MNRTVATKETDMGNGSDIEEEMMDDDGEEWEIDYVSDDSDIEFMDELYSVSSMHGGQEELNYVFQSDPDHVSEHKIVASSTKLGRNVRNFGR